MGTTSSRVSVGAYAVDSPALGRFRSEYRNNSTPKRSVRPGSRRGEHGEVRVGQDGGVVVTGTVGCAW